MAVVLDVPSEEMEAWLNNELEKPCGFIPIIAGVMCGKPASWLIRFKRRCFCVADSHEFFCGTCKLIAETHGALCAVCREPVDITFYERIKA